MKSYKDEIKGLEERGLKRRLTTLDPDLSHGDRLLKTEEGRTLIDFSSNDYLGLKGDPRVVAAMKGAAECFGVGSGASRSITGSTSQHAGLEEEIATFKGAQGALLFNSGYQANTGSIPALLSRSDEIFMDRLSHASLIDGALLSRASLSRFAHCDMDDLERLLKSSTASRKLIITEGLFSMDGTVAPIEEIVQLAGRYDAYIYLDDSHGTGVLGPTGRGRLEGLGLKAERAHIIEMGTFGKAFGTYGAFIAGPKEIIDLLVNRARAFIFSTSLPAPLISATRAALRVIIDEPERIDKLRENSTYLRKKLKNVMSGSAIELLGEEDSPIAPLVVGDNSPAMDLSKRLISLGFYIQAIRPPTVPDGTARLRITLSSAHRREELDSLIEILEGMIDETK